MTLIDCYVRFRRMVCERLSHDLFVHKQVGEYGLIADPCGVPRVRSCKVLSGCCSGEGPWPVPADCATSGANAESEVVETVKKLRADAEKTFNSLQMRTQATRLRPSPVRYSVNGTDWNAGSALDDWDHTRPSLAGP